MKAGGENVPNWTVIIVLGMVESLDTFKLSDVREKFIALYVPRRQAALAAKNLLARMKRHGLIEYNHRMREWFCN